MNILVAVGGIGQSVWDMWAIPARWGPPQDTGLPAKVWQAKTTSATSGKEEVAIYVVLYTTSWCVCVDEIVWIIIINYS